MSADVTVISRLTSYLKETVNEERKSLEATRKDLLAVGMCALSAARVPGVATSTVFQGSDTTAGPSVTQCAIKEENALLDLGYLHLVSTGPELKTTLKNKCDIN